MKVLKNIIVGFLISFIGSIPLGYLNVIGYQLYLKTSIGYLLYYLLGVIIIESIVVYGTLVFADKLSFNEKLRKRISVFSIFFLLLLAFYFYNSGTQSNDTADYKALLRYPAVITGILLSSINFAQFPFWMSWNLYLVNENYIYKDGRVRWFYILGAAIGTLTGMLLIILVIENVAAWGNIHSGTIQKAIPILFILLALFQVFQLFRKKNQ